MMSVCMYIKFNFTLRNDLMPFRSKQVVSFDDCLVLIKVPTLPTSWSDSILSGCSRIAYLSTNASRGTRLEGDALWGLVAGSCPAALHEVC